MRVFCIGIVVTLFSFRTYAGLQDTVTSKPLDHWAFSALNIPQLTTPGKKEIVVAIIDDGFRLSHNSLKGFLYKNTAEIPGNRIDDDNNGYIDDYQGWDVSDNDADVSISATDYASMYHGTFVASLVTQIAQRCWSAEEQIMIKILPVKVLSDHAENAGMVDGYRGIDYAINQGADIICCAWSGNNPATADQNILQKALKNNILLIGAAGNMYREQVGLPAAVTGILAVSALDTLLHKKENSNYGMEIDLSLPGMNVRAAYPLADNAWFYGQGTSAAAGLATGCAAVLKCLKPEAPPWEIAEALKNTAMPLDSINPRYAGKLGSGFPDLSKAVTYLIHPEKRVEFFHSSRPEGSLFMGRKQRTDATIQPAGAYASVVLLPDKISKKDSRKKIALYSGDSLVFRGMLQELQHGISVSGSSVTLRPASRKMRDFPASLKLNYYVNTIDSTKLFCRGTVVVSADEGDISDGSGDNNYANYCSCAWQISVPDGKRIRINFKALDTEPKVDFIWLFDGEKAQPDHIIAKLSGREIPPVVTSRTNMVYVWFVTDSKGTGQGWKLHFEAVPE